MEEDFKLLLTEYTRAVGSNPTFTDSPKLIPILLANGAFTPSRLEHWPFAQIAQEMDRDATYRVRIIRAFESLATHSTTDSSELTSFVLNEKKALSFLLANRDTLLPYFNETIVKLTRIHLAALEYGLYNTEDLRSRSLLLPIPVTFPPKLKSKYPRLAEMFAEPSISHAKEALNRLKEDCQEERCILDCAARHLDSKLLYTEIITPSWNTPITDIVLDSMKHNPELEQFCTEYLKQ